MNALVFFLLAHLVFSVISGIAEGGGGIVVTKLTADMNSTDNTAEVLSTSGYLKRDYIVIGDEYIQYTDKDDTNFTNLERGWNNTEAKSHAAGTKVFSSAANPLNAALGFSVLSTGDTVGSTDIIKFGYRFMTTTLPRLVTWDYGILEVGPMQYLRVVLQILGGAFIIYLILSIAGAFGGGR